MAKCKNVTVPITGASATIGTAISWVTTAVPLAGQGAKAWPVDVAEVQRTLDTERAATARAGATVKAPKRFDAIVEAVEQVLKVRGRPPGASDTAYAKRIRDRVEAALRKNGTMEGKRRLGVIMVRKALVAAEQRALSQKNSDAFY
jgi:hypothetical protein